MTASAARFWIQPIAVGLASGLAATLVKSASEPRLQKVTQKIWPPAPGEKDKVGADPSDHEDNMPPSVVVKKVGAAVTGSEPSDKVVAAGQQGIHMSFGIGFGVLYALAAARKPGLAAGFGIPAGLTLYAGTHGSLIPAVGIQPPPTKMPLSAVVWESSSHAVYGLTLDLTRRALNALAERI